jgi:signal transduction histidine kinase
MAGGEYRRAGVLPSATGIYLGAGLLAAGGLLTIVEQYLGGNVLTLLFYTFMDVVLPLIVIAVGAYLSRTDLSRGDVGVATLWFVGGVSVLWVLYTWAVLPDLLAGDSLLSMRDQFVLYGNLGGSVGLVAGINRARARQNQRLVEQTSAQQDTLEFINYLLRHNVLNGLQVISGYTDLLEDHVDAEGDQLLERIDDRSDHMTELIDNVRVLMRTLSSELDHQPTDLSNVLESEVNVAATAYTHAEFETEIPDEVVVSANPTLGAVFENVLANAVKHNDTETPHVHVTLTTDAETATVRVADDGPGIPDHYRETYLQQEEAGPESTGEGLGLYLVATLVEAFEGTVRIEDNDPRGTVVVVELPLDDDRAADARR